MKKFTCAAKDCPEEIEVDNYAIRMWLDTFNPIILGTRAMLCPNHGAQFQKHTEFYYTRMKELMDKTIFIEKEK